LLIGRNGQVGWELQRTLPALGRVIALDRSQLDLTQPDAIRATIRDIVPDIVVNAAGYTTVDKAEAEPDLAMQINAVAPGVIAEEAKRTDALLVHYSTDYVFDGTKSTPYTEDDPPNPVNVYGRSKLAGERAIAASGGMFLILRTSWIYGPRGTNFVRTILRLSREKKELSVVNDQTGSPTAACELAFATCNLLSKFVEGRKYPGVFHLSAKDHTSRFEFAVRIIEVAKQLTNTTSGWAAVKATTTANFPLPAARPLHAATSKEKVLRLFNIEMAGWESQLKTHLQGIIAGA